MLGNIHHGRVVSISKNFMRRGATRRPMSPPNHPSIPGFMGSGPTNSNAQYFGSATPATLAALKASAVYGDVGTAAPANLDHLNTDTFGLDPVPATLVALKADAQYGDAGTAAPANGAAANDPAWAAGEFVMLGDNSLAKWNGTAWVVATSPREPAFPRTKYVRCANNARATWDGTEWIAYTL